ncbi:urea ABC transporter ATP-binding protein UrtD [Conexibacter woesei]|uniref:Urea ABC transporter, ATP-binding protein UrtD n=1 Tax=Conexibacter woesei (strain DSM 14684 / CCUG 47730 / CIP 108061 / JCM 11494 / NBRC 100937 / ID131577) TaxID=469383 RepID=D3EZF4_CONWI|nr:urea ABC transporter ATP-binding protein UrtD [Conexibacter woesei]ADB51919.1 urea ABC transporter, ATP-binding protein UrtD [Conexibacter woesei DSM 14684]
MSDMLLEVRGLKVVFDGFHAIDGLDLTVERDEIRFLIGPNGAGKTTLVDAITGLVKPAAGSIRFEGAELVRRREHQIVRRGVGRTFQTPTVFEQLTVLDNVDVAASFRMRFGSLLRQRRGTSPGVLDALRAVGLDELADANAGVLSHGQRQWLEVAMVLVQGPRLLLLDEPVAGMTGDERTRTGELIERIAAEGTTVLVIEHDMDFVRRFATRVTVMHEGRILTEGTVGEVQQDETVREVYLGRPRDARGAGAEAVA